ARRFPELAPPHSECSSRSVDADPRGSGIPIRNGLRAPSIPRTSQRLAATTERSAVCPSSSGRQESPFGKLELELLPFGFDELALSDHAQNQQVQRQLVRPFHARLIDGPQQSPYFIGG